MHLPSYRKEKITIAADIRNNKSTYIPAMRDLLLYLFVVISIWGCAQKKPSSFEIHYAQDRTDSAVLVNHQLSSDQSCSFYMEYNLFFRLYQKKNMDLVYDYYQQHNELKHTQAKYTHFMALKYCFHHKTDSLQYDHDIEHSAFERQKYEQESKKEYISPKMHYHQEATNGACDERKE